METELIPLSKNVELKSVKDTDVTTLAYVHGFINLKNIEPSLGIPENLSTTIPSSAYYFLIGAKDEKVGNSRRFTGHDTLFLSGNKLSYNNNKPTFNFDISGNFRALSAYIPVLSTSAFFGASGDNTINFNEFDSVQINSNVIENNKAYFKKLSAQNIFVTGLTSLSTRYDYFNVPSSSANRVFSSISWNVTAGRSVSAENIKIVDNLITPYFNSASGFFNSLTADYFTIKNNMTVNTISANHFYGKLNIDTTTGLVYQSSMLSTNLSASYFFGVKPSDSKSTDNINIKRSLMGAWDNDHNEKLPVLKPYFKNLRQVLDYSSKYNLYGKNLNILIYDDIYPNNTKSDGTFSNIGCTYSGNISGAYYPTSALPVALTAANIFGGDFFWNKNSAADPSGGVNYFNTGNLNFSNLNIVGMYEIGSVVNFDFSKEYTYKKPFNYSPRKITFRTYVSTNKNLAFGNFGQPSDWNNLYMNNGVFNRGLTFDSKDTDVNLQNLCFEFDCNSYDSTGIHCYSGNTYLSNITVSMLGYGLYSYGAIASGPRAKIYICGVNQIDPYLLTSPVRWNSNLWKTIKGANGPDIYPGYGLAIVGNPAIRNIPTWLYPCFTRAYQGGNTTIMDFNVNRQIGRFSYLNSAIILDGNFSSECFYLIDGFSKIYSNNYIFRTNTFTLSNYGWGKSSTTGLKYFGTTNANNFYYFIFNSSFSTFKPNFFPMVSWEFNQIDQLNYYYQFDNTQFTCNFGFNNSKYVFNTTTKTIDVSGMVFGSIIKNSLEMSKYNDNNKLYNYVGPYDLPLYDNIGFFQLISPFSTGTYSTYTLNYYASANPTIYGPNVYLTP
jgi:hypothetical protein